MFGIKVKSKEEKRVEQLEAENAELREQIREQSDALTELAEIIEEATKDG